MGPITKNVIVVDEFGIEYTSTYAKRAKGLVKQGRARWLDGNTICLVCPPDRLDLEDNNMENRADNMTNINEVCAIDSQNKELRKDEQRNEELRNEKLRNAEKRNVETADLTVKDILNRIDMIIAQGEGLQNVVMQIQNLPVNDSPHGGEDGAQRAKAISNIYTARETTNQKMIDMLNRMYDDLAPGRAEDAKAKVLDKVMSMKFDGVTSGTATAILDFIGKTLM